jgi:diadenosine tetraphosphatase ApaH/serine/threonine PP2A family protein phosphatase
MALRAIISDVHGNLEALRAVLHDIRAQGADEIVCLGDVVGYGPNPVECVSLVRKACRWCLCGNHDAALFMNHAIGFNEGAAKAVAWQRGKMMPSALSLPGTLARWSWLENLRAARQEGRVLYVHASPRDPLMEYVLEEDFKDIGFGASEKAVEVFENFEWLCFVGHSHRPGIATHDLRWIKPHELHTPLEYRLPVDKKTLVNIGAVGQPRDKNKDACYVLFDGQTVRFRRVPYDIATTMKKIEAIPALEKRLAERLAIGM